MNAERLLEVYEQISEAPDAIARLRTFVLDLAVRGKLVEQDPTDEPASTLLDRMTAERAELERSKAIKKVKLSVFNASNDAIPFNWIWTQLGTVGDWGAGSTPQRGNSEFYGGDIPWLKSGELGDSLRLKGSEETVTHKALAKCSFRLNKPGDVLIAMYGATIGKLAILAEDAVTNQAVCGCTPFEGLANRYLFLFLLASREAFHASSEGGAQPNISKVKIVNTRFPLPPLAEQHRIVAKVDELMALCDRLAEARKTREELRDKVTAASLARLTAPDTTAEDFPTHAAFALEALPALTTRPDQIKTLRQTILNLAVRGKLVEQDVADEPAADLLERIEKEKAKILSETGMRKPRKVADMDPTERWTDLPVNWAWTQLSNLGFISPRNEADDNAEASFVPMPMIFAEYGVSNDHEARNWGEIKKGYTHFAEGDIGLAKITPCFENGKSTVFRNLTGGFGSGTTELHVLRPIIVNPDYIVLYLKCPQYIETGIPKMTGTAGQKRVPSEYFTSSPFALPPLAEQQRIVAKVDALMALCDRLEAALATADTTRTRLLESLLHEALEPAATTLEAAE
ncbi:restriction endonuclease subunit S [Sulfitobacter sp. 1A13368]|uniref:restriction endonuclease subunit S n=1 Tax=Sulfitobacter sp. 1A13368 TaxID=3368593 RepID=UPI0037471117